MRGDIYAINLNTSSENVQNGKRPVVIIQNNIGNLHAPTTIICPITSAIKKRLPTHVGIGTSGGLNKPSVVLCEQIFTINKKYLTKDNYIGTLDATLLKKLDKAISVSLGIEKEYSI